MGIIYTLWISFDMAKCLARTVLAGHRVFVIEKVVALGDDCLFNQIQEAQEKAAARVRQQEIDRKQREIERKRTLMEAQIKALQAEFEADKEDIEQANTTDTKGF